MNVWSPIFRDYLLVIKHGLLSKSSIVRCFSPWTHQKKKSIWRGSTSQPCLTSKGITMKIHGIPIYPWFSHNIPVAFPSKSMNTSSKSISSYLKYIDMPSFPFPSMSPICSHDFPIEIEWFMVREVSAGSSPSSSARKRSNGCAKTSSRSWWGEHGERIW